MCDDISFSFSPHRRCPYPGECTMRHAHQPDAEATSLVVPASMTPMPAPMVPMVSMPPTYFAPVGASTNAPSQSRHGRSSAPRSLSPAPRPHGQRVDPRTDCPDFMAGRACSVSCQHRHSELARFAPAHQTCWDFARGTWCETNLLDFYVVFAAASALLMSSYLHDFMFL